MFREDIASTDPAFDDFHPYDAPCYRDPLTRSAVIPLLVAALGVAAWDRPGTASEERRTAMVRAVEKVRPSVVNLRGNKTLRPDEGPVGASGREVNGMGTGVVIDERGYILTNYHVVEGVRKIEVTLADGTTHIASSSRIDPAERPGR